MTILTSDEERELIDLRRDVSVMGQEILQLRHVAD